jgi:hypothetical protein
MCVGWLDTAPPIRFDPTDGSLSFAVVGAIASASSPTPKRRCHLERSEGADDAIDENAEQRIARCARNDIALLIVS